MCHKFKCIIFSPSQKEQLSQMKQGQTPTLLGLLINCHT